MLIWSAPSADFVHKIFYATPSLLAQNGFRNPTDPLNTAMRLAFDAPGKAPYEIFVSKRESAKAIGTIQAAMGVPNFYRIESVYPIHERLVRDSTNRYKMHYLLTLEPETLMW